MIKVKSPLVKKQITSGAAYSVNMPKLLEYVSECTYGSYAIPLSILPRILLALSERAAELNDPALNIIMIQLGLYDKSDVNTDEKINVLRHKVQY